MASRSTLNLIVLNYSANSDHRGPLGSASGRCYQWLRSFGRQWVRQMDIAAWLSELGLERYSAAFLQNDITADVLPHLSADDLKELGVVSVGHRRQLLAAIGELAKKTPGPELENGAPSVSAARNVAAAPPGPPPTEAERRQITVMFCDLVGSTALSARLDPEEMREIILAFQRCCARVVSGYGGFVAKYLGDGALVYFGYPRAHEDDAERTVRAALDLLCAIRPLATPAATPLHSRIGISTGLVVVGDLVGE